MLRRGMTVHARMQLRQDVLQRHLALAYQHAAEYGLSRWCKMAMQAQEPGEAKNLHEACYEEKAGGGGCLCPCHDVADGEIFSGMAGPAV
jgi:hypothetical protein